MPADPGAQDHRRLHAAAEPDAVGAALAALRARGERVTAPRRAVLEALAHHAEHLTADEVAALLEDTDVHRATVYRTLELLAATGVVSHRHVPGGAARYHLAATGAGREHLHGHCLRCGEVVVLPPDPLDGVGPRVLEGAGFRLDARQSTLVGLCARCAGSSIAPATDADAARP
ncbi:transcriptional repressor [Microbacterium sp. zg.B48]|uniref:Fur family transcriptional regulator n=1 Tax=unclassified Microbacterium TaxID=2609290 RepID=UPI00214AC515|nr:MULTISPECIES: transcriptional repressor [unclassified Microbacterium]MCR2764831.1 transcriptional repressor [Microbacterium sp. zg.B48]MCR2810030.1 transcriptional repressor [Microbacterium sp. zg.B185]WIM20130.1 transcriptional repressor [Microbacterium sp. zg-B185]